MSLAALIRRIISMLVVTLAVSRCGPTAPTSASAITIDASVRVLKTGESWQFAVTGASGPETWSSDNPDVCSITSSGLATAHQPGATKIRASGRDGTATVDLSVVPSFDGEWVGHIQLISDTRVSGAGPVTSPAPTGVGNYSIHIDQAHDKILAHDYRSTGELLTGVADVAGEFRLEGTGVDFPGAGSTQTRSLILKLDAAGVLSGEWVNDFMFTNAFGPQVYESRLRVFEMTRQASK